MFLSDTIETFNVKPFNHFKANVKHAFDQATLLSGVRNDIEYAERFFPCKQS